MYFEKVLQFYSLKYEKRDGDGERKNDNNEFCFDNDDDDDGQMRNTDI